MEFAILNFVLSGAIFVVSILTLQKVSTAKEVVFALLPLFFALHQFTQGFVWLGLNGLIKPRALHMAEGIFVFYAQGLLQFLVPLAIWLLEPKGMRRNLIAILTLIGAVLTAYTLWGLSIQPTTVYIQHNALVYINPVTKHFWVAMIYILTTCGSLILSSSISIQLYGMLNLIGIVLVRIFKPYAFTSVWCLYAAVLSVVLYFHFLERRIAFLRQLRTDEYGWSEKLSDELLRLEKRVPQLYSFIVGRFEK
jgi:hypothetical protein